jgi:hypothetical protein
MRSRGSFGVAVVGEEREKEEGRECWGGYCFCARNLIFTSVFAKASFRQYNSSFYGASKSFRFMMKRTHLQQSYALILLIIAMNDHEFLRFI